MDSYFNIFILVVFIGLFYAFIYRFLPAPAKIRCLFCYAVSFATGLAFITVPILSFFIKEMGMSISVRIELMALGYLLICIGSYIATKKMKSLEKT